MIRLHYDPRRRYHCYHREALWASRGRRIYKSEDLGQTWEHVLDIHAPSALTRFYLYCRTTGNEIRDIIPYGPNTLVVLVKGNLLVYRNHPSYPEYRIINVVRVIHGRNPDPKTFTVADGGTLLYGDSWENPDRQPVSVYSLNPVDGRSHVLLSLKKKKRITFIQPDTQNGNRIFLGTGESGRESGLYRFDLETRELEELGGGEHCWLAPGLIQRDRTLYWGSCVPDSQNSIYSYDLNSGTLETIGPL